MNFASSARAAKGRTKWRGTCCKDLCGAPTTAKGYGIDYTTLDFWVCFGRKPPFDSRITQDCVQGYKKISCSTQLSMNFFLLINCWYLTFMSRKNSILCLPEPENC